LDRAKKDNGSRELNSLETSKQKRKLKLKLSPGLPGFSPSVSNRPKSPSLLSLCSDPVIIPGIPPSSPPEDHRFTCSSALLSPLSANHLSTLG